MKRRRAGVIETPCGPMTRHHAAVLSGLSVGTIIRRVWEGWPAECLFDRPKRGQAPPRPKARNTHHRKTDRGYRSNRDFVMPYSEFKRQKQQERADAHIHRDLHRENGQRQLAGQD